MAHYALLDENNVVVQVITGRNENDLDPNTGDVVDWEQEYAKITGSVNCKRTSYNTSAGIHYDPTTLKPSADQSKAFRKNYAGKNMIYNEEIDGFIIPQPYSSWTLNSETGIWHAPTPYPDDGNAYNWNEETQEWDLIVSE
jgi:hypothetical protein